MPSQRLFGSVSGVVGGPSKRFPQRRDVRCRDTHPSKQRLRDSSDGDVRLPTKAGVRFWRSSSELRLGTRSLAVRISAHFFLVLSAVAHASAASGQAPGVPSITSAAQATYTVGKAGTFTVKATGTPKPTLAEDGELPTGVTFKPPTLSIAATTAAGIYNFSFKASNSAGTVRQSFTLIMKAKPAAQNPLCDNGTYTARLSVLQGADADGLAQTLNGVFDRFSVVAVPPPPPPPNGNQSSGGPSGQSPPQQNSPMAKQYLCVYLRDTADPITGKLRAFTPVIPTRPPRPPVAIPQDQLDLQSLIQKFDRSEFAGVGLDGRFVMYLANIDPSDLATAFPAPAPGLEVSSDDVIGQHYLILHPTSIDIQLATKAAGDLASQAAKVKRDFLELDAQRGLITAEQTSPLQVNVLLQGVSNLSPANFREVEVNLERWDATHTVNFAVLDPREVALGLGNQFPGREIQVLAKQRSITIRPPGLNPNGPGPILQEGIVVASDAIERQTIYDQTKAESAWEAKLQSDSASSAKQVTAGSSQQPVTQTNSTTTITTPQATSTAATKTAPAFQVQTTTSTQTASPSSAQGSATSGNAAQNSNSNPAPTGNGGPSGGSNSGGNAGAGTNSGSGGAQGNAGGPGSTSSTGQAQQASQPFPTGTVVRLFHLRQASNIATVVNAMAPGAPNTPLVQALSDYGNDDLLLILPPAAGQQDNTESLRRMIVSLDEPRPTVSLQVWSYEISSEVGTNPDDRRGRINEARDVSDAYGEFTRAVQHADAKLQDAMSAGMAAAMNYAISPGAVALGPFFNRVFHAYLTEKFEDCVRSDRYCLGYENALTFPHVQEPRTGVTLERFVVLLASADDNQAQAVIDGAIGAMDDLNCQNAGGEVTSLCFDDFKSALTTLALPRNLHQFRAAVLDFLFQYKQATAYPNDFAPYYLQRSAQNLDGYLNGLITALDRDLDRYLHAELEDEAQSITHRLHRRVGLANYGEVQIAAISGDAANVSGVVNNYFDITPPALLKDIASGLLSGAGGSSSGGGNNGQSGGSGGGSSGTSGGSTGSGSGSGGSSTTGSGSGSSNAAGSALASAAKLLTPWQAVALNALAAASAPPQLMAQINAQTTLAVTPISLDTASAAELSLSLQISNPTTTIDASKGTTSSFIRQDLANSVANYSVQTKVRVDSLKLFQVSSLSMDLTRPQSSVPVPIIGWAWEAVFGSVPVMKEVLEFPRGPKTIQNRSIAVVRAVVVPTAMDLGLSIPFRDDRITDPVTGTSESFSSSAQTSNKFQEFHQELMNCILGGGYDCMTSVRLSGIPEQTY